MNPNPNSTLLYQTHLLADIFSDQAQGQDAGLRVYQNNIRMTAARSLSISYPVIYKMIGEQAQYVLAKRLIDRERPVTGDWADWGREFSNILQQSELDEDHPYLSQMAELEWAFQVASRSVAEPLDKASLSLLEDENVEEVAIKLQRSLTLISSDFPLYGLWRLHRNGDKEQLPKEEQLHKVFNSDETGYYLVWQSGSGPRVVEITKEYFDWFNSIQRGKPIGKLLDSFPDFDFSTWLSDSIVNEWLVGLAK